MGQKHMLPTSKYDSLICRGERESKIWEKRCFTLEPAALAEVGADSSSLGPRTELGKLPLSSLPSTPGHLDWGEAVRRHVVAITTEHLNKAWYPKKAESLGIRQGKQCVR